MRRFYSAVVERNVAWNGEVATEPYEAGWASEAIAFVRVLETEGGSGELRLRAQISADGMQWCDEGSALDPISGVGVTFLRLRHFGNWLRLAGETDSDTTFRVLVTWALKE
jgi:hypothetical protein